MSSTVRTKYILIHGLEKCPTRYEVNEMHRNGMQPIYNGHHLPCNICREVVWGMSMTRNALIGDLYVCKFAYNWMKERFGQNIPPHIEFDEGNPFQYLQSRERGQILDKEGSEYRKIRSDFQTGVDKLTGGLSCSICMTPVSLSVESSHGEPDKIVLTPCCHYFHHSCLVEWIQNTTGSQHRTCPICRSDSVMNPEQYTLIEIKKADTELIDAVNHCFEKRTKSTQKKQH